MLYLAGFNEHLKELHGKARECNYLVWKDIGRPRTGDVHDDMRVSGLRFKYVFRQCRANEEMMRADALAHSLSSRDSTLFWKDIGKMANSKVPLASKVENAVGNHKITDMWKIHFSDLLNSVHNTDSKGFVSNHIDAVDSESHITITASDVLNSLKETKLGKSAGIDELAAEHFIHSHVSITVHLSLLFSCMDFCRMRLCGLQLFPF